MSKEDKRINQLLKNIDSNTKEEKQKELNKQKESKKTKENSEKFKFNFKKFFLNSLILVVCFLVVFSIFATIAGTTSIKQKYKIITWSVITALFVLSYLAYFIVIYKKEKLQFLLNDPYFVEERQAKEKYKYLIKFKKEECKKNNIKFTSEMKKQIHDECFTFYIKKDKSKKTEKFKNEYIYIPKVSNKNKKTNQKDTFNVALSILKESKEEDLLNSESHIETKFLKEKKQAMLVFDEKTKAAKIQLVDSTSELNSNNSFNLDEELMNKIEEKE